LRAFVAAANGEDAALVLKRSRFAEWTTPVQPGVREVDEGYLFEAIRFVSGKAAPPRNVVVDPREQVLELTFPPQYSGRERVTIGLARDPVMTLHHWVHILWANQIAAFYEAEATSRWRTAYRITSAVLRARSVNRWKVLRKFSSHGKGCDIHPTALI